MGEVITKLIRAHILDILAVDALSILLVLSVFLIPWAPLRIGLGLPYVLLFPGYILTSALHPRRTDVEITERLMLSLALSLALAALTGFFVNFTPWGIRLIPILVSLSLLIFALSGVAIYRRLRIAPQERFHLSLPKLSWSTPSLLDSSLYIVLGLASLALLSGLIYQVRTPNPQEMFTQFYILGSEGKAGDFPGLVRVGEPVEVTIGIINGERRPMNYTLKATLEGEPVNEVGPIYLTHGGKWEGKLTILPLKAGNQKLEFSLSSETKAQPSPPLYLPLDVVR